MRVGMEMTEEEKNTIEVEQTQFEKEKSHKQKVETKGKMGQT